MRSALNRRIETLETRITSGLSASRALTVIAAMMQGDAEARRKCERLVKSGAMRGEGHRMDEVASVFLLALTEREKGETS